MDRTFLFETFSPFLQRIFPVHIVLFFFHDRCIQIWQKYTDCYQSQVRRSIRKFLEFFLCKKALFSNGLNLPKSIKLLEDLME